MTVLADADIRARVGMIEPFCERTTFAGMTYGLSMCGYDVRLAFGLTYTDGAPVPLQRGMMCLPCGVMVLGATIERFDIPNDLRATLCDKSSWIRRGLTVGNTRIEPGWRGFLTVELLNTSDRPLFIETGAPIGQMEFELLSRPVERPYDGKYQDQEAGPQPARYDVI